MTDAETAHRVEQAVLGAMMARPRSAAQMGVKPGDFADERHQAIAAALTGQAGSERGLFGRLVGFFTRRGRAAREAAEYMDTLLGLCPDPGHIASYFRMLGADRDQRAQAQQAAVQAQGNQVLDVAADRLGQMRGRTDNSTGMPLRTARLARALVPPGGQRGQTNVPAPGQDPAPVQGQGPVPAAAQGQAPARPFQPAPVDAQQAQGQARDTAAVPVQDIPRTGEFVRGMGGDQVPGPSGRGFEPGRFARREDLEDAILAGLLKHPDEARGVTSWLTPEAFTGPRRELFTMIGQYTRERRDIDPVTLAWGAAQANEARTADTPVAAHEGWLRPEFVLRLYAMSTVPGAASVLGKSLLAEMLFTDQHGPEWYRPRRPGAAPQNRPQSRTREQTQDQVRMQPQPREQTRATAASQAPEQVRDREQQPGPEPRDQQVRQDQGAQRDYREQEDQQLRQYERAMAANRRPGAPDRGRATEQQGPYRQSHPGNQSRPGDGNHPPVRAGQGNQPVRGAPGGGLIGQPPPISGQDGPSRQQSQSS
jgi:hypothetical protein